MSTEDRAFGIEEQVYRDISKTLRARGINHRSHYHFDELVEALTLDAMHQVEKLLVRAEWDEPV